MNKPGLDQVPGKVRLACFAVLLTVIGGCDRGGPPTAPPPGPPAPAVDAAEIVERHLALDSSETSVTNLRATITEEDGARREVRLTMYGKREPDGRRLLLVHFTFPREERDRDGLVTAFPDGQIEALRYAQSADSFVRTSGAAGEDSLFGMTLQELVNGQPEKYEFSFVEESAFNSTPVYELDGKLRAGADSKFPRMVMFISKENHTARAIEFYDNRDELQRRMTVEKVDRIDGIWTRMRWALDNPARGKKIDFEVLGVKYNDRLADSVFTRDNLKRLSSR